MLLSQKPCKFLSFCLISFKFLMLEHCFRYKRVSTEKDIYGKGQQFFQGGARVPLAPLALHPHYATVT